MWLRNLYKLPQQISIMITASFPPVDDLIINLSKIEYKKHLNQLIHVAAFIAAVCVGIVSFIWKNLAQWYKEGGKDDLQKAYNNAQQICSICILWIRVEGYPFAVKSYHGLMQTYRAWCDLVTV